MKVGLLNWRGLLRVWWKALGAMLCWLLIFGGVLLKLHIIVAIGCLLFLTVPCGIKIIRKNKMLWLMRQALFFGCGITNLILSFL